MFRVKSHREQTLLWWFENRFKINMAPTYQRRGSLWSKTKKALLIDSVLNEYDIPKIYLADFTHSTSELNEAKTPYAVIDGKQRLETFFDFFEGNVVLAKDFVLDDEPTIDLKGFTYLDLKQRFPRVAQKFEKFSPAIMSVVTDDEDKVDEMYVRLNSGLAVNAAERRNAMRGPIPRLIRKLALHPFFTSRIAFDTSRMAEYNTVAKILLIENRGRFVDTKAKNLDRFVQENEETKIAKFEATRETIIRVLKEMTEIFHERDRVLRNNGPIPLYYWLTKNTASHKKQIRPFVEQFMDEVKANLLISQENPDKADAELTSYYTMGRTTNDQGSLSGRYEILQKRFRRFLKKRVSGRR